MFERIKAIIAYFNVIDKQGEILDSQSLQNIKKAKGLPVTYNFNSSKIVGRIVEITPKQNQLIATIEPNKKFPLKDFVFRVQGRVLEAHKQKVNGKDINVIDKFDLFSIGLVPKENDVYTKEQKGEK